MPILIGVVGWVFNVMNASLKSIALSHLPPGYSNQWIIDPHFLVGGTIFFLGFVINVQSDYILRNLRKPGEIGYKLPHDGLFRLVTAPNYFGEILEWCGWAVATWSLAGVAFAVFTFSNLAPRAWAYHKWYH